MVDDYQSSRQVCSTVLEFYTTREVSRDETDFLIPINVLMNLPFSKLNFRPEVFKLFHFVHS